jgi:TonB family protein
VRGVVVVRFYIDEEGNVRLPSVTGQADGYLVEQALTAVREWKFAPVTSGGQPVLVAAQQEFNFGSGIR